MTVCVSLMLLGSFLLFGYEAGTYSKLFWFLLLPPMLMFCLGLRHGTLLFALFFALLLLSFFGPLRSFLPHEYPLPDRLRFLAAMSGAWIFSALNLT